jgi:hypothetical protein
VAAVLDTATGWHRVAMTATLEGKVRMIGLWVRDSWWEKAGRGPQPKSPVAVLHVKEPRSARCEEIVSRAPQNEG